MLYFPNTRITNAVERPIAAGQTIDAVGCALVATMINGVFGLKKSTGVAGEKFAGASLASVINPASLSFVEQYVVGAGATHTAVNTPLATSLSVFDNTTGAALTVVAIAAASAAEVQVVGGLLTHHAGSVGHTVTVSYKYAPTVQQARFIQGDESAGRAATFSMGTIGLINEAEIMTSEFDTLVNWNVANPTVTVGANGMFTIGGTGVAVPNAYVTSVPTPDSPYLGLHFSA